MTDEERNQLSIFEARLRQLMFVHDELKAQHAALKLELEEKNLAFDLLQEDYQNLKEHYTNLKQAGVISRINDSDVSETRQRLSRLVREIDKCLALLKGE